MSLPAAYFDDLYAECDDPWRFRGRWYELRKRSLMLATLPQQRYDSAFELGCSNGELSVELARRCERLLCCDASPRAVALARERLAESAHVAFYAGQLPQAWPEGRFDLIVISELGYYLDEQALAQMIQRCIDSLSPDGVLLACHWLHPIAGCPLDGAQVHRALQRNLPFDRIVHHAEEHFIMQAWSVSSCGVDISEATL